MTLMNARCGFEHWTGGGNPTAGLLAWWRFNEGSGSTAADSSGNGKAATLANGASWTTGLIGGAVSFDGSDNAYCTFPSGFSDFSGGLTLSLWVYITESRIWARFFDLSAGSGSYNIIFTSRNGNGKVAYQLYGDGSALGVVEESEVITNSWVHYAVTHDASSGVTLYKNGVSVATGTISLPPNIMRTSNFINNSPWGDSKNTGKYDDARIYGRALSSSEIAALYNWRG